MTDDRVVRITKADEGSIHDFDQRLADAVADLRSARVFLTVVVKVDGSVVGHGSSHPTKTTSADLLAFAEEASLVGPEFVDGCVEIATNQQLGEIRSMFKVVMDELRREPDDGHDVGWNTAGDEEASDEE